LQEFFVERHVELVEQIAESLDERACSHQDRVVGQSLDVQGVDVFFQQPEHFCKAACVLGPFQAVDHCFLFVCHMDVDPIDTDGFVAIEFPWVYADDPIGNAPDVYMRSYLSGDDVYRFRRWW